MTTKPKIFTAEDFRPLETVIFTPTRAHAADIANRIIESKLGPKVWGYVGSERSSWISDKPGTYIQENYNHTAYLFDIQKLPEKVCEHEPDYAKTWKDKAGLRTYYCQHCNIELTARWEAKK